MFPVVVFNLSGKRACITGCRTVFLSLLHTFYLSIIGNYREITGVVRRHV